MAHGYLRYPHLHGDLVAFTAADDVWIAPVAGGRAWRVSHDSVPVTTPRFSPDGTQLAWASTRDGHPEVMVQELATGETRRLTHWGAGRCQVIGWTADGRVLASTNADATDPRLTWVRAVDFTGRSEELRYGVASSLAIHEDGAVAVSTGGRTPAHWKRYRGGTAARLWLLAGGGAEEAAAEDWQRLLPDDTASLVDPLWLGNTLVFTSDREASLGSDPAPAGPSAETPNPDGQANLWAINPLSDRPRLRQLTHSDAETGYVRDASTDGRRIVWHSHGRLYLLNSLRGTPKQLEIELPGVSVGTVDVAPTDQLDDIRPDRTGDASVLSWRGSAVLLAHREGPARTLADDSASRIREPQPLGATGEAVWVRNSNGVDTVERAPLRDRGAARTLARTVGRVLHLQSDPQGKRVAMISHDGAVRIVEVAAGRGRQAAPQQVGRSEQGEAEGLAFSADGRYLVWHQPTLGEAEHHQLMLFDTETGGDAVPLTSGRFHDTTPQFTSDGKYLVFLSARTFDPSYDQHSFGLSFASSTRPWLVPLSATEPAPFGPSADGWRLSSAAETDEKAGAADDKGGTESGTDTEAKPAEVRTVVIDHDGFEERIVPFPVPSGEFRDLQSTKAGVVWIRESGSLGVLGTSRAGVEGDTPGDVLEAWTWATRRAEALLEQVDSARVSGDGVFVVCRAKDTVTVRPADRRLESDDKDLVTVDLSRLRRQVDLRTEWQQMYAENARIMADHYWRADLDGVDWNAVTERYRPVLDRVVTHDDLVDLLWEVVGELNTSHAYVMPSGDGPGDDRRLGHLGVDLSATRRGWRIDRVLPGESSDPGARSPLRAAGVDARPGDLVVAVDGRTVDPDTGPGPLLQGAVDKPVELTLRRGRTDRRVVVVPVDDESTLRYQDWVRGRAAYVAEHSEGRLGYLHIPDMMSVGWAQLHRDLARATDAEGLVVDVRFNRGGHTSQLVIERLARRVLGWATGRHFAQPMSYPGSAPRGPVVLVANEYSGSDGDIVNAAAQALDLGPVIGLRTWGGVVGIDGRFDLVDGTGITQPRYSHWFDGYGWGVENHGVDPDIEVAMAPSDWHSETDPQLDRAIAESLDRLAETPAATPPALGPPRARSPKSPKSPRSRGTRRR